jgi:hypothetical protein
MITEEEYVFSVFRILVEIETVCFSEMAIIKIYHCARCHIPGVRSIESMLELFGHGSGPTGFLKYGIS